MDKDEKINILFVDDDPGLRTVIPIALRRDGWSVTPADSGAAALDLFGTGENFDLVIQDVKMPGMDGIELLTRLKQICPDVPVIVMTAYSTWDTAVSAMRLGAFDYIKKPFDNNDLRWLARRAVQFSRLAKADDKSSTVRMVGSSPAVQQIQQIARRVSASDSTILIEGESGTGKELVAALIHSQSHRRNGPFIAVNCGGFSETLLESELFGHVRGAFTGAVSDKRGLLELADGGSFFLDEVGEMTLATQVRLLRVLETKTFTPVGGERSIRTDVRFIAASNRDMKAMSDAGTFRMDLYYRLNVIPIHVTPLRERQDDIPLLAGHFLAQYNQQFGRHLDGYDPDAIDAMLSYSWPGNIREMQNIIQRAVLLSTGPRLTFTDIFPSWKPNTLNLARSENAKELPPLPENGFDLEKTLEEIEDWYIRQALEATGGSQTQAAEKLGMNLRSLRYKLKKLGIHK